MKKLEAQKMKRPKRRLTKFEKWLFRTDELYQEKFKKLQERKGPEGVITPEELQECWESAQRQSDKEFKRK